MFRYSFKILPDRLRLIRLYPCGSLGQSISFVFGVRVGHFAATPQSDVGGIWSRDLGVMATLLVRQKMPFSPRAFVTLRSVSPTSSFSASTKIVSKITPNLGHVLYRPQKRYGLLGTVCPQKPYGLLGTGRKSGRGYGGRGRGRLYTYRYTVTTRINTAFGWAAIRAILMFKGQVQG